uniref:Uncharacterized protein n=1 Tax=Anguilla anguilla TaxID=7936 RepID=A0A0E9PL74_ANGAN
MALKPLRDRVTLQIPKLVIPSGHLKKEWFLLLLCICNGP